VTTEEQATVGDVTPAAAPTPTNVVANHAGAGVCCSCVTSSPIGGRFTSLLLAVAMIVAASPSSVASAAVSNRATGSPVLPRNTIPPRATLQEPAGPVASSGPTTPAIPPADPVEPDADAPTNSTRDPAGEPADEPADEPTGEPGADPTLDPSTDPSPLDPAGGPPIDTTGETAQDAAPQAPAADASAPPVATPLPPPLPVTSGSPWGSTGSTGAGASPWGEGGDDGRRGRGSKTRDRTRKPGVGLIAGGSVALGVGVVGVGVLGAGLAKAGRARDELAGSSPGLRSQIFEDGAKANRMAIAGAVVMGVGMAVGIALIAVGAVKRSRGGKKAEAVAAILGVRVRLAGSF
jgi:hypothetical protein